MTASILVHTSEVDGADGVAFYHNYKPAALTSTAHFSRLRWYGDCGITSLSSSTAISTDSQQPVSMQYNTLYPKVYGVPFRCL